MQLEHFLAIHTKITKKCIKDPNLRLETIKLLEENIGRTVFDIKQYFFDLSPKAKETSVRNKQMRQN